MATFYNTPLYHSNITDATGLISLGLAEQHHSNIAGAHLRPISLRLAEKAHTNADHANLGTLREWERQIPTRSRMPTQSQADYEEKKENMMPTQSQMPWALRPALQRVERAARARRRRRGGGMPMRAG